MTYVGTNTVVAQFIQILERHKQLGEVRYITSYNWAGIKNRKTINRLKRKYEHNYKQTRRRY